MSVQTQNNYQMIPFPLERRIVLDAGWIHRHKSMVSGLIEVDVTDVRSRFQEHKVTTGESLSFTAFILSCLGQAVEMNKQLHAYRNWRNQLVVFDDVDIAVMIEIDIDERKFPLLHVIRAVNKKTFREIHREIREVQAGPSHSANFNQGKKRFMSWFLRLPAFLRHIGYRFAIKNPLWFKEYAGTVAVSSVGMFANGGGWGIGFPNHSLSMLLGGIAVKPGAVDGRVEIREYLSLTISFDHVIIDGAPAARFVKQLTDLIEAVMPSIMELE